MDLIEEVADYLEDNLIGTVATDIFLDQFPASPVNCFCVSGSGGIVDKANPIDEPTFSISIRGTNLESLRLSSKQIYDLLHNKWNILEDSKGRITADTLPGNFYFDEAKNVVFVLNFRMYKAFGGD